MTSYDHFGVSLDDEEERIDSGYAGENGRSGLEGDNGGARNSPHHSATNGLLKPGVPPPPPPLSTFVRGLTCKWWTYYGFCALDTECPANHSHLPAWKGLWGRNAPADINERLVEYERFSSDEDVALDECCLTILPPAAAEADCADAIKADAQKLGAKVVPNFESSVSHIVYQGGPAIMQAWVLHAVAEKGVKLVRSDWILDKDDAKPSLRIHDWESGEGNMAFTAMEGNEQMLLRIQKIQKKEFKRLGSVNYFTKLPTPPPPPPPSEALVVPKVMPAARIRPSEPVVQDQAAAVPDDPDVAHKSKKRRKETGAAPVEVVDLVTEEPARVASPPPVYDVSLIADGSDGDGGQESPEPSSSEDVIEGGEGAESRLSNWTKRFLRPRALVPDLPPDLPPLNDDFIKEFGESCRETYGAAQEGDESDPDEVPFVKKVKAPAVKSPPPAEPAYHRTVSVMNLPWARCKDTEVKKMFIAAAGGVKEAVESVEIQYTTGPSPRLAGTAKVVMRSVEEARKVRKLLDSLDIDGRTLKLTVKAAGNVKFIKEDARYFIKPDARPAPVKKDQGWKKQESSICPYCAKDEGANHRCPLVVMCGKCGEFTHPTIRCPEMHVKGVCTQCGGPATHAAVECRVIRENHQKMRCLNCGETGHICCAPQKVGRNMLPVTCNTCGRMGHMGHECNRLPRQQQYGSRQPQPPAIMQGPPPNYGMYNNQQQGGGGQRYNQGGNQQQYNDNRFAQQGGPQRYNEARPYQMAPPPRPPMQSPPYMNMSPPNSGGYNGGGGGGDGMGVGQKRKMEQFAPRFRR